MLLIFQWVSSGALAWSVSLFMVTLGHSPFRDVSVPAWFFCETPLFQRCTCSGRALAVGQSHLRSDLLRQGVCPSVRVSVCVLSDFFRCFPKSSCSVSPPVPRSIFSMCIPAPLASSCYSSLSIFKQKYYVHLWLRFWLAVDCSHPFFVHTELLLTSAGQPANSSHASPLPLVASAVEHSKPRYTNAASVKLPISLLMD